MKEIINGDPLESRQIAIYRDAIGSVIVSGDGNKVFIRDHLDNKASVEKPNVLGANPYRGLAAFQIEDAAVYFGREVQVNRLWNRLENWYEKLGQESFVRVLPVLGPSGSGKSSLVRAGLLPELAKRPLAGLKQPRVMIMTPGSTPLHSLSVVLARIAENDLTPARKTREFLEELKLENRSRKYDGFRRIASMLPNIENSPLIVLIDQFEEIYSLCKDVRERQIFIENLLEAASTSDARVSVVITLRSDFLGETQTHSRLNQIIGSDQSVIIPAMTVDELRRAIEKPAKQAGHALENATIDLLIEQTRGREGALPLLQFALTRIWEGLSKGQPPDKTLREIGGVGGALAGEAQRIYDSLQSSEKDFARRFFLGLVELGEGTRNTRRRTNISSLISSRDKPDQVKNVLNHFSAPNVRLITLSGLDDDEFAEVTHEALLENWKLLNDWLDGKRSLIHQKRIIEELAKEWLKQGHNKRNGYFLQGKQLTDANRFRKENQQTIPLSAVANEYILKSLRKRWMNRCFLLIFIIVPAIVIENYLREENVMQNYARIVSGTSVEKREAVKSLTRGCGELRHLPAPVNILGEKIFGNCRSLAHQEGLRGAPLQGLDLAGVDFSGVDLSNANLADSSLDHVDLNGANLEGANLTNADLGSSNLSQANLSRANLQVANLENASLIGANLDQADLFRTDFSNAELSNVNLQSANLRRTKLSNANLNGAFLFGLKFEDVDFSGANLFSAILEEADLSNSDLNEVDFSYSNLRDAKLINANLNDANFYFSNLFNANFSNSTAHGTDFSEARYLIESQLESVEICQANLPASIQIDPDRDCG